MKVFPIFTKKPSDKKEVEGENGRKPNFSFRDYLTMTLSVLAFCISALGFYFSNLRVSNQVTATTVEIEGDQILNPELYSDYFRVSIQFVITNKGNKHATLLHPYVIHIDSLKSPFPKNKSLGGYISKDFPLSLESGEAKSVTYTFPFGNIRRIEKNFNGKKKLHDFKFAIVFPAIDGDGMIHTKASPYSIWLKDGRISAPHMNVVRITPIEIF